jgi:DNA polymerase-3 subunit epsilon
MFETLFKEYKRLVFFDTETTGFDPEKTDQITELAALTLEQGKEPTELDAFVHLFRMSELPPKIVELTGITDILLASEGRDEVEVIRDFVNLMQSGGKTLLIAHNAQFDLRFIAYAIHRHKEEGKGWMMVFNDCDYLDTLTVYKDRRRYPHKLENAIAEYGLAGKVQNSHRAIDDTKALMEVARKMEEEKDDLIQYINIFGFNPKYGPEKQQLKKVTYVPQALNNCPPRQPSYTGIGGRNGTNK